ncbi:hypothetical protein [Lewinella sp. JB7]|uniref:hypothetical protein n=1 Tax=Lewinella sp. JB7 TaxID=2962887 RepID=UPI0020C9F945|nr:hypothetical protein [Lewinella sp. JB7]MCP9235930.1 hypothetical protein [Lewinella sp. JB7]
MADRSFSFRWWYLLFLLPLLLYAGARWYVGYRIDRAIAGANDDSNTLTVAEYTFGFFPLEFSARDIRFDQQRKNISATGYLHRGTLSGLRLFSLFGDDPIAVDRLALTGFDARLVRTGSSSTADSSTFAFEVGDVQLDSTFLEIDDRAGHRLLRLSNLHVAMQTFQLPFQPTKISDLQLRADSTLYAQDGGARIAITRVDYDTESSAILAASVRVRRGDSTDVRAENVRISGLNTGDFDGAVSVDSLSVAHLGGGARVQRSTPKAEPSGNTPNIRLGHLSLPDVDLAVSGSFGTLHYAGNLRADELNYRDSFDLRDLQLNGRDITYRNDRELDIRATDARIDQGHLQFPLSATTLGATSARFPSITVTTDKQEFRVDDLRYRSDSTSMATGRIEWSGDRLRGSMAGIRLEGIDRDALLDDGVPATIARAVVTDTRMNLRQQEGGAYEVTIPTTELYDLVRADGFHIARVRLSDATATRFTTKGEKDMVARGIYLDQYNIASPFSLSRIGHSKLRVTDIHMIGNREPIDYIYANLAYSSRTGTLTLDSLNRINRLSPDELFSQGKDKSWLSFSFDGIRASGIDHGAMVSGESVHIDSLVSRDFRLRVVEDITIEVPERDKQMPMEALRSLGPRIVLNGARLSSTDIAYGVVDSVHQPKTIHFSGGTVRFSGLDTKLSTTDSLRVSLDATFEKTTPIHTEFALSRDSSGRNYAIRGWMGSYDLSRINPLMEVAADAIIETGVIDSLSFHGRLQNELMTGELTLLYHDLDLKVVGPGAWIKNLLSGVVMKDDNLPGEDFRQGRMYHEHPRTKSFFNAFWKGLVSGMKSSALSDIALPKELD